MDACYTCIHVYTMSWSMIIILCTIVYSRIERAMVHPWSYVLPSFVGSLMLISEATNSFRLHPKAVKVKRRSRSASSAEREEDLRCVLICCFLLRKRTERQAILHRQHDSPTFPVSKYNRAHNKLLAFWNHLAAYINHQMPRISPINTRSRLFAT